MQTCKYNRILTLLPLAATLLLGGCNWGVLDPQGPIGEDERSLIVEATLLMLVIVVPVIVLVVAFAWRYRASNTRSPIARILPGIDQTRRAWSLSAPECRQAFIQNVLNPKSVPAIPETQHKVIDVPQQ